MDEPDRLHDVEALIDAFEASDWREAHIKTADIDLFLSKDAGAARPAASAAAAPDAGPAPALTAQPAEQSPAAADPVDRAASAPQSDGLVAITAPNLGTFYRAPKPGAPPYVDIGQRVEADTEVCLIEVMKLFTAVRAEVSGTIREICVSDGEVVEFGQALFRVEPEA
ncbi:MAG: acetyl-CoA carboxylase biotin carboxyl carrier protein [Rhodothalassiaceae bacterium]